MWAYISKVIIRYRILFLLVISLTTAFMFYKSLGSRISFIGAKILPLTDTSYVAYNHFRAKFGDDGSVFVLGISDPDIFRLNEFNDWYKLGEAVGKLKGVSYVLSTAHLFTIRKDTVARKFIEGPMLTAALKSQQATDSVCAEIYRLPFYEGFLFNKSNPATLMAISINQKILNSKFRTPLVHEIMRLGKAFGDRHHTEVHFSGLPFIRSILTEKIALEFRLFLVLSILATALILFLFFKSIYPVLFSMLVVIIGVIWSLGILNSLGYEITLLTALIPSLMVIIGIPNSTLLLNRYHAEFQLHGNKILALETAIEHIGFTTFIANITTAIGFGVFFYTRSQVLGEFGVVAFLSIMSTYLLALFLIPILFSFLPPPKGKNMEHLENKLLQRILDFAFQMSAYRRKWVYGITFLCIFIGFIGILRINVNGFIVDDLPKKDPVYTDLKFFEKNFEGILPFEISIDTKHKNGIQNLLFLAKLDTLEKLVDQYPIFTKAISINKVLKYSKQAFYNGNPDKYILPSNDELPFLTAYAGKSIGNNGLIKNYVDSSSETARVSFQMADIGSKRMNKLLTVIKPRIDSLFPPAKFKVQVTGSSIVFINGTNYLVKNLFESLALAVILISFIMIWLFKTWQMVLISLIPNLIPLVMTAGIMGFADISLKPSTILIFSIAFGLASDQTIYLLTRYWYNLKQVNLMPNRLRQDTSLNSLIKDSLKQTGVSMIYAAVILFAGFSIFDASQFGGTVTLGILVSITLVFALISNLVLLPTLLFTIGLPSSIRVTNE